MTGALVPLVAAWTHAGRFQADGELSLGARAGNRLELVSSERLAGICDVHWRRRHGQRPDPGRTFKDDLSKDDAARVARVVDRLDQLAPLWKALAVNGELAFEWPSSEPVRALRHASSP